MGLRHTRNIKGLVEIDVALGWRRVGILFGQTQHLVEFLAQNVGLILVIFERLLEGVFAAACLAAHVLHGDGDWQQKQLRPCSMPLAALCLSGRKAPLSLDSVSALENHRA